MIGLGKAHRRPTPWYPGTRDRVTGTGRVEGEALYKMSGDLSETLTGRNKTETGRVTRTRTSLPFVTDLEMYRVQYCKFV